MYVYICVDNSSNRILLKLINQKLCRRNLVFYYWHKTVIELTELL